MLGHGQPPGLSGGHRCRAVAASQPVGSAPRAAPRDSHAVPTGTVGIVDDLVHEGFLVRVDDFEDQSVLRLRLASKGRARLGAWRDQGGHILDDALASLSDRERSQLVRALPALAHLADALEHLE